jgi:hypothetical protein
LFVLFLCGLFLGSFVTMQLVVALMIVILSYGFILMGVIFPRSIREKKVWLVAGFPLSVATMHLSWGMGFLISILNFKKKSI